MFTDGQANLSKQQALVATAVSTNTIDLTQTTRDIGVGEPVAICVTCDVALAGTSPTLTVQAIVSSSANLSSPTVVVATQQFSALAAGSRFYLYLPPGAAVAEYLGLNYVLGGTSPTVTLTANVIPADFAQADAYGAGAFIVQ